MTDRHDLGVLYQEQMRHYGLGSGLFHPVSASDMNPPCIIYLDRSRRVNHICNIPFPGEHSVYEPLEKVPQKMAELKIEWRPKTSLGVREYTVAAEGETPDGLPAGAKAAVRYSSKTNFGAVLIAQKPVTLTSYNDETCFRHWILRNFSTLAQLHGVELSRYGMWLVTRTYTCSKASINAWQSKDKDAVISVKAKADMVGDLGASLDWSERGSDKDWSHHSAPEGVVAFFDGIEVPAWQWWFAGAKARIRKNLGLSRRYTLKPGLLGPRGSFKPFGNHPVDPENPPVAPGADDAWVLKSPPARKENKVDVIDHADEKDAEVSQPNGDTKPGNHIARKHLSMASTESDREAGQISPSTLSETSSKELKSEEAQSTDKRS